LYIPTNLSSTLFMDPIYTAPTPPDTPSAHDQPKGTAAQLERLSSLIIHAHNERDFDFRSNEAQELVTHISPLWKGEIDTNGPPQRPISWAEQVAAWKKRAEECPDVHFAIQTLSSEVNERSGVAKVYMEMVVTGIGDLKLHAMNELRWRRVEGLWLLHYTLGMRGSPGNTGIP